MSEATSTPDSDLHPLRIDGVQPPLRMRVHGAADQYVSATIARDGIWEPQETRLLLATLRPGDVFVDVGANIGYFTLIASRAVGESGAVLAFEPEAENFRLLEHNCRVNACRNVRARQLALGRAEAEARLYLNEDNRGDHSLYPGDSGRDSQGIRVVNGSRLILGEHPRVDCVKIDTQGAECEVVAGLLPLLEASLPRLVVLLEFSPMHLRNAGTSGRALLALLAPLPLRYYLMDYGTGGLLPVSAQEVRSLSDLTDADPSSEGFFNLVLAGAPLEDVTGVEVVRDWGMFERAVDYFLLRGRMPAWAGEASGPGAATFYLPQGWGDQEDWGRWSIGPRSRLRFVPAPGLAGREHLALYLQGRYYGPPEATQLRLNGQSLGACDLTDCRVPLPAGALRAPWVELELLHTRPLRPRDLGEGDDDRPIKFGLEQIAIR